MYGSNKKVGLYTLPNWLGKPEGSIYLEDPKDKNSVSNKYVFKYPGLTIVFVHVGNVNKNKEPIGLNPDDKNAAGSVRIGDIAGPGGEGDGYYHTHIAFYSKYTGNAKTGTRVDPREIFCNFKGWSWSLNDGMGGRR
jgi:hypothetical protein